MPQSVDGIVVPYTSLHPDTLRAVAEEFVTRSGTDYGEQEQSLEAKIEDVVHQLRRGEALLVYDPETNSVNLIPAKDRPKGGESG